MSEDVQSLVLADGGRVSAIARVPPGARWLYVLAHGAGAGMRHVFMETMADALFELDIGTFRYQFPYTAAGRRRPDPPALLHATVRAAVDAARASFSGLRLIAGGKSMGGRMTSQAQALAPLPDVDRLAFLGFPLHPAKKVSITRAEHLTDVTVPMLFLQGTRDALADLEKMRGVCRGLGTRATLIEVEGADHAFALPKSRGRSLRQVCDGLATDLRDWLNQA